jgi:DNA-directed RNA polymerase subunit RPC12/RpoP
MTAKYHCQECGVYLVVTYQPEPNSSVASCPQCGAKRSVPGRVIEIDDCVPDPEKLDAD